MVVAAVWASWLVLGFSISADTIPVTAGPSWSTFSLLVHLQKRETARTPRTARRRSLLGMAVLAVENSQDSSQDARTNRGHQFLMVAPLNSISAWLAVAVTGVVDVAAGVLGNPW